MAMKLLVVWLAQLSDNSSTACSIGQLLLTLFLSVTLLLLLKFHPPLRIFAKSSRNKLQCRPPEPSIATDDRWPDPKVFVCDICDGADNGDLATRHGCPEPIVKYLRDVLNQYVIQTEPRWAARQDQTVPAERVVDGMSLPCPAAFVAAYLSKAKGADALNRSGVTPTLMACLSKFIAEYQTQIELRYASVQQYRLRLAREDAASQLKPNDDIDQKPLSQSS